MSLYEHKSLYWIFAILVILIAPIIVLLTPIIISIVFFDEPSKIVVITYGKSLIMYVLSFTVATLTLIILYFLKSLIFKIFMIFFALIIFLKVYSLGINYYVYLDKNYIEYNPLFGDTIYYEWTELTKVAHEMENEYTDQGEKYIFEFSDGSTIEFSPTGIMDSSIKNKLYKKIMQLDISFEEY